MSHRLIPHAVWFTVAIGAYGLGKWSVQSQSDRAAEVMVQAQGVESGLGASPSALLVRQTSEESDLDGSVAGAKRTFGQGGIETIAKEAFSDPNPLKRELAFARLLGGLTPENAEEIREQLRDGSASGDQWRLFQYAWGSVDGPGALSKATEIERKDWREGAISTALSGWASADPSKAIAWLGEMDEGERGRYQDDLVNGLADSDIGLASDYVLRMVESGDRRGRGEAVVWCRAGRPPAAGSTRAALGVAPPGGGHRTRCKASAFAPTPSTALKSASQRTTRGCTPPQQGCPSQPGGSAPT